MCSVLSADVQDLSRRPNPTRNLSGIDRAVDYPYTRITMLEANEQLTLEIHNGFLSFYYYFAVGLSVLA